MAGQRFQTHTIASEGVEQDDNYQKMVADIEEQTQRSGWLFGRGAFDKADLQYLRDFNSSLRYKEVEIEDKERELWEREKARLEAEAAEALQRRPSGGSSGGVAPGAGNGGGLKGPPGIASKPAPLLVQVKVRPCGSKQQQQARATSPDAAGQPDNAKRLKTAAGTAAAMPSSAAGPSTLPSARSEPAPATGAGDRSAGAGAPAPVSGNTAAGRQGLQVERMGSAPAAAAGTFTRAGSGAEAGPATAGSGGTVAGGGTPGVGAASGGGGGGLATLLGGYGSDEEDDDECQDGSGTSAGGAGAGAGAPDRGALGAVVSQGDTEERKARMVKGEATGGLPPPVGLLSPEELLADPRVIAEGLLATRPAPEQVQGGDAWDSAEGSDGSDLD